MARSCSATAHSQRDSGCALFFVRLAHVNFEKMHMLQRYTFVQRRNVAWVQLSFVRCAKKDTDASSVVRML